MKLSELMTMLEAAGEEDALVMAIDGDSGIAMNIDAVKVERHLDADGSLTVWLRVSEY